MSCCSGRCCSGCQDEIHEDRRTQRVQICHFVDCSKGEISTLDWGNEDEEDTDTEVEIGDQIYIHKRGQKSKEEKQEDIANK